MLLSVDDIQKLLDEGGFRAHYRGPGGVSITGFSDPGDYRPQTAIWLGASKYLHLGEGMECADVALLFAAPDFEGLDSFPAVFVCDDPRNAFMYVVESVVPARRLSGVSEHAHVDPSARLGERVYVGPGAFVDADVSIGDGTMVYPHASIKRGTVIGADCVIMDGCVIGNEGFGFRRCPDGALKRLPHLGRVVIGDSVEVGSNSIIDKGTFRDTVVESGTKIDTLTVIGHNAHIGRDCFVIGGFVGGNSVIGDGCELIHMQCKNRVSIGAGAKVGIGSVVIRDIPGGVEVFGNPARVIRK